MHRLSVRILSLAAAIVLIASVAVSVAGAGGKDVWSGEAAEAFSGGDGTAQSPYIIKSGEELALFASLLSGEESASYSSGCYSLGADIRLNAPTDNLNVIPANVWAPISSFSGVFDGCGYSVYGLYVNAQSGNAGLFDMVTDAVIKNLAVRDSTVSGETAGAIAAVVGSNSTVSGCYASARISGTVSAGGICGENRYIVEECYSSCSVYSESGFAGMIAGKNSQIVRNCLSSGNAGSESGFAGGIIGTNSRAAEKCLSLSRVTGKNCGMVCAQSTGTVSNCFFPFGLGEDSFASPLRVDGMTPSSFVAWNFSGVWLDTKESGFFPSLKNNVFEAEYPAVYTLTVEKNSDSHFTCSESGGAFVSGSVVEIEITPDEYYVLKGISVNTSPAEHENGKLELTIDKNCTVSADVRYHEHQWSDEFIYEVRETCLTDGSAYYTCAVCPETKQVTVPATGHKMKKDDSFTTILPTCETPGWEKYICTNPGCTYYEMKESPAKGHKWGSWTEDTNVENRYYRTCSSCHTTGEAFLKVGTIPSETFTGSAITPDVDVYLGKERLTLNSDYIIAYKDNISAGTATATVKGLGPFSNAQFKLQFSIAKLDMSSGTASVDESFTYAGAPLTPPVTVTFAGRRLVAGADYDVSYSGNDKPGTASVKVTGKGNYKGSCGTSFEIAPASVSGIKCSKDSVTVAFRDTVTVKATIEPDYAENKKIAWSVSGSVAEIYPSEDGMSCTVRGIGRGEAKLTAKSEDGEKTATVTITATMTFWDRIVAFFITLFGGKI